MAAAVSYANAERALLHWAAPAGSGGDVPDWIWALAEACDRASQGQVAKRLGISAAVVNQVLGRAYKGRLDRVEARVRGELMQETVACPVLGALSKRECLDHQAAKFAATNPLRVRLYRACRTCPHREGS